MIEAIFSQHVAACRGVRLVVCVHSINFLSVLAVLCLSTCNPSRADRASGDSATPALSMQK
eukprot:492747-Rhodomonas_salina.2